MLVPASPFAASDSPASSEASNQRSTLRRRSITVREAHRTGNAEAGRHLSSDSTSASSSDAGESLQATLARMAEAQAGAPERELAHYRAALLHRQATLRAEFDGISNRQPLYDTARQVVDTLPGLSQSEINDLTRNLVDATKHGSKAVQMRCFPALIEHLRFADAAVAVELYRTIRKAIHRWDSTERSVGLHALLEAQHANFPHHLWNQAATDLALISPGSRGTYLTLLKQKQPLIAPDAIEHPESRVLIDTLAAQLSPADRAAFDQHMR